MTRARLLSSDAPADLELACRRLGLSPPARQALLEELAASQVLLTGLTPTEARLLRGLCPTPEASAPGAYPVWVAGEGPGREDSGLLCGRRGALRRLLEAARQDAALEGLARALGRVLEEGGVPGPLVLGGRTFTFGARTYVMGVVNVTPDSFSDGGRYLSSEAALAHGLALAEAGADVLDVGGESTRPGSLPISADEELARVLPVVEGLRARTPVPVSVDTTKAEVAREVLRAGASLINDISGFTFDEALARVVAEAGAACCLMHLRGTPETMQRAPHYEDVVDEVLAFLEAGVARALAAGVPRPRVLVDPGIGFGKTFGHNLYLLRRLGDLRALGQPVLVGTSRKGFLGALTGGKPASERLAATLGSVAAVAVLGGADFVRVHDVAEARDALAVADAVRGATEAGALYLPTGVPRG